MIGVGVVDDLAAAARDLHQVDASWIDLNALACRAQNTAIATRTRTTTMMGTSRVVRGALPIANAVAKQNTMTPVKNENARHTIGESRKRLSRGVNAADLNCKTRNSSE